MSMFFFMKKSAAIYLFSLRTDILLQNHAVQSLTQIFTEVVQIKRTSGQVRVQNLCKQIED